MELLQKAFAEALVRNAAETERWTKYRDDHRQAVENLDTFRKRLEVDVMVPIGGKALMPGKLYHTNEILCSHSSKLYSKCTADQAITVCQHRVGVADERLKALGVEREMYQNKLDLPAVEDAFCAESEQEIIEEYDEQAEIEWREKHRIRVREHKQRERAERELIGKMEAELATVDADVNVNRLDSLDIQEDLENELSLIPDDKESDEIVRQLLNDAAKTATVNERKRVAHASKTTVNKATPCSSHVRNDGDHSNDKKPLNVVSSSSDECSNDSDDDDSNEDEDDTDEEPEQMKALRLETSSLTAKKRLKFFGRKLCEWERKYRKVKKAGTNVEAEIHCMFMCDALQSEIFRLEDDPSLKSCDTDSGERNDDEGQSTGPEDQSRKPRRSVSFGVDEVASFSKHQAPRRVSEDLRNSAEEENSKNVDSDEDDALSRKMMDTVKLSKSASTESLGKSILKNRTAVNQEPRRSDSLQQKATIEMETRSRTEADSDADPRVEFDKILGNIFENVFAKPNPNSIPQMAPEAEDAPDALKPSPLPNEAFRNAHEPKQRISRFKASRQK